MVNGTLLVFLKYPRPGRVKTRLAETLGPERAADLYRGWITQVFEQLQPIRGKVRIVGYYSGARHDDFSTWHHLADNWIPQPEGDLGEKLNHGFSAARQWGSRTMAVGTDCLELDAMTIRSAIEILEKHDVVFGPAMDGGYYLVGANTCPDGFFRNIRWSGPHTLADHRARCEELNLSIAYLPCKRDIDTIEDLRTSNVEKSVSIGVVIPVLNEQAGLAVTLKSILDQSPSADRVVVSDGHSVDDTVAVAQSLGVEVHHATTRGRGSQIAEVVKLFDQDVILVVHADMILPPGAMAALLNAFDENPELPGGCLGHRFDTRSRLARLVELADARRAGRGVSYGDQAQFFRRAVLETVGGFPNQPIMEDIELSRRLTQLGRPGYLDLPVTVSARRFERLGYLRTVLMNQRMRRTYNREGLAACTRLYEQYTAAH